MIKYTFEKKFYIVSEVKASPSKFFQEYTIFMRTRFLNGADFGSMLRNLQLSIFSAATQLGIFTVLLVANEVVVASFLKDDISFLGMSDVIEKTMARVSFIQKPAYEDYVATDAEARRIAKELIVKN